MDTNPSNSLKTKCPTNPRARENSPTDARTDSTRDYDWLSEVNYEPSSAIPVQDRRHSAAMLDQSEDTDVDSLLNIEMLAALAHHVSLSSSFPPHMHYHRPRDDDAEPQWHLPGWSLPNSSKKGGTPPDSGMLLSSEESPMKQCPGSSGLSPSPTSHKQSASLKFDRSTLFKVRRSLLSKFMKSKLKLDPNQQPSTSDVNMESGSSSKQYVSRQLQTTTVQCNHCEQAEEHTHRNLSLTKTDKQLLDSSPLLVQILSSPESVTKPVPSLLCSLSPEKLAQRRRTKSLSSVSDKLSQSRRSKHRFSMLKVPPPPVYPWPESTASHTSGSKNTAVPEQVTLSLLDTLASIDDQNSSVAQSKENVKK